MPWLHCLVNIIYNKYKCDNVNLTISSVSFCFIACCRDQPQNKFLNHVTWILLVDSEELTPHRVTLRTFTSAEGAHAVDVLSTRAALPLLLEALLLENMRLSLPRLLTNTKKNQLVSITVWEQTCSLLSLNHLQTCWHANKPNKETGRPQLFPQKTQSKLFLSGL